MQHTGILFLSRTKPEISTVDGQFALTLLLMDNLGAKGKEPYRVRWLGQAAQDFWKAYQRDLVPGAIVDVELSHLRAANTQTYPPMPHLVARVVRMSYCPKRPQGEDAPLSNSEHYKHCAATAGA